MGDSIGDGTTVGLVAGMLAVWTVDHVSLGDGGTPMDRTPDLSPKP